MPKKKFFPSGGAREEKAPFPLASVSKAESLSQPAHFNKKDMLKPIRRS